MNVQQRTALKAALRCSACENYFLRTTNNLHNKLHIVNQKRKGLLYTATDVRHCGAGRVSETCSCELQTVTGGGSCAKLSIEAEMSLSQNENTKQTLECAYMCGRYTYVSAQNYYATICVLQIIPAEI